jgi:uncharacterized protein YciI
VAYFAVTVEHGPAWNDSRPMREQDEWDAHARYMDHLVDEGFIVLGGPLADEYRVALVVDADDKDAVNATLDRDPWTGSHLVTDAVEPWTIRLDGRRAHR